jgi:ABC-type transport system substrate-binding protein
MGRYSESKYLEKKETEQVRGWFSVFMVALTMVILLSPWSGPGAPQAASPTAVTTAAEQPQAGGKIEKGAAAFGSFTTSANNLFSFDSFWRSNSGAYGYVVMPAGIDKLIDQAKLSRTPADVNRINRQIVKLIYDDVTVVPLYLSSRMAIVDKSVQNSGWFIYGDADNNEFGTRTWLKK